MLMRVMRLTADEWDIVLHALQTAAELHDDTAATAGRHGAERLAGEFRRRAGEMRVLADRIEQTLKGES